MAEAAVLFDPEDAAPDLTWHWTKPLERPSVRPRPPGAADRAFWAVLLALMLAAAWLTATDSGAAPQPRQNSALLTDGALAAASPPPLQLHSAVARVDLPAGRLELDLQLWGAAAANAGAACARHEIVVSSAGAERLVAPLCSAHEGVRAVLPLARAGAPYPFEQYTADVAVRVRPAAAAAGPGGSGVPRGGLQRPVRRGFAAPAPPPPLPAAPAGVEVVWTAVWAAPDMQVAAQRRLGRHARLLAAAAGPGGPDGAGGWGSGLWEAVEPGLPGALGAEAAFVVTLARSSWLRVVHLAAALLQLAALAWCAFVALGHCLCAYMLQRFLCQRLHMG